MEGQSASPVTVSCVGTVPVFAASPWHGDRVVTGLAQRHQKLERAAFHHRLRIGDGHRGLLGVRIRRPQREDEREKQQRDAAGEPAATSLP